MKKLIADMYKYLFVIIHIINKFNPHNPIRQSPIVPHFTAEKTETQRKQTFPDSHS